MVVPSLPVCGNQSLTHFGNLKKDLRRMATHRGLATQAFARFPLGLRQVTLAEPEICAGAILPGEAVEPAIPGFMIGQTLLELGRGGLGPGIGRGRQCRHGDSGPEEDVAECRQNRSVPPLIAEARARRLNRARSSYVGVGHSG